MTHPFTQNRIDTVYDSNPSVPAWRASFYWLASGMTPKGVEALMPAMDAATVLSTGHVCEAIAVAYTKLADLSLQLPLKADEFSAVYGATFSMPADAQPGQHQRGIRDIRRHLAAAFRETADTLFRKAAEAGEFAVTYEELPTAYKGAARRSLRSALARQGLSLP